ncbi:hypothetical protein PIB30_113230, partial [Stylosanthes scabra]|nr:hypothetical protein [Stylosanthes scabra]
KIHAYAWKESWQQATTHDPCRSHSCVAPNFTRPRICVESIKYDPMCWTSSNPRMSVEDLFIFPHPKSHAYAQNSKHIRGKPRSSCKHHDLRTHVEDHAYAWRPLQNLKIF